MKLGVRTPHSELDGTMHRETRSLKLALLAVQMRWRDSCLCRMSIGLQMVLCVHPISHPQLQHCRYCLYSTSFSGPRAVLTINGIKI